MRIPHQPATLIGLLYVAIALSAGCSRRPSDDAIAKNILNKIAVDPDAKDSTVNVTAKDGKITLRGTAKTPAARQKVEQIAQQESGATGVDDQITVQPEAAPEPAPEATTAAQTPPPQEQPAPAPPPKPQPIVVPAGTVLTVKTGQALSSKTSQEGQTFLATLAQPISVGGKRALPTGATVSGRVVTAKAKGKIKGEGQLAVELTSLSVKGHTYQIQTNTLDSTIKGKGKRTAATTAGGAAGGALIGGLAGGGKGAGIGALVGAGAGLVGGAVTGNKQIELPAETALSFTLAAPLTLRPPNQ
jgi:hypothetical protein